MNPGATLAVALAAVSLASCFGDRTVPDVEQEELDRAVERIAAAQRTSYWSGRTAEGFPLTLAELQGPGRAFFGYGTCELPEGEGGCPVPAEIQNFPFRAADWRRASGCKRQPDVRGVPAAHHDSLVLFTGRTVVKIYAPHPRRVAAALHAVGSQASSAPLPPPPASVVRLVDRACGRAAEAK